MATARVDRQARSFWLFVAPWLVGFVLLTAVPLGFALWMSFTDYDGLSQARMIGLENYRRAFADPEVRASLLRTIILMAGVVPLTVGLGLGLAIAADQSISGRGVYRAIVYLPSVVPIVAGSLAFRLLFDTDSGAVNGALQVLGFPAVPWLGGTQALLVLVAFMMWTVGGNMVISLAGLQSIPLELTEAAVVDGANAVSRFWHVTLPTMSPILLFQVVTGVIAAIQTFIPSLLLSTGAQSTGAIPQIPPGLELLMLYVYRQYFGLADFGYASALLWLLFIVIVGFTALVFWLSRPMVHYVADRG